jgi:hypothetical protein
METIYYKHKNKYALHSKHSKDETRTLATEFRINATGVGLRITEFLVFRAEHVSKFGSLLSSGQKEGTNILSSVH